MTFFLWTFRPPGVVLIPQFAPGNQYKAVIFITANCGILFYASLSKIKTNSMENNLYIVAVIFVITWFIGFFAYAAGGLVHTLLVLAVIAVLLNITGGNRRRI